MKFNDQQKSYIENVSKELMEKVKVYLSSVSDSENLPDKHKITLESDPCPELLWNEKIHFSINLRFPPSKSRYVCMDLDMISWNKFVNVSTGVIYDDFANILPLLDKEEIIINLENEIFELIDKLKTL